MISELLSSTVNVQKVSTCMLLLEAVSNFGMQHILGLSHWYIPHQWIALFWANWLINSMIKVSSFLVSLWVWPYCFKPWLHVSGLKHVARVWKNLSRLKNPWGSSWASKVICCFRGDCEDLQQPNVQIIQLTCSYTCMETVKHHPSLDTQLQIISNKAPLLDNSSIRA